MTTQILFFADDESMEMLMLATKEERLSYIDGVTDTILSSRLIKQYNMLFGDFTFDHVRNYFYFLKDFTIDDALSLYDRLSNKLRADLIYAIGFDHNHLNEMIAVHNYFCEAEFLN